MQSRRPNATNRASGSIDILPFIGLFSGQIGMTFQITERTETSERACRAGPKHRLGHALGRREEAVRRSPAGR